MSGSEVDEFAAIIATAAQSIMKKMPPKVVGDVAADIIQNRLEELPVRIPVLGFLVVTAGKHHDDGTTDVVVTGRMKDGSPALERTIAEALKGWAESTLADLDSPPESTD